MTGERCKFRVKAAIITHEHRQSSSAAAATTTATATTATTSQTSFIVHSSPSPPSASSATSSSSLPSLSFFLLHRYSYHGRPRITRMSKASRRPVHKVPFHTACGDQERYVPHVSATELQSETRQTFMCTTVMASSSFMTLRRRPSEPYLGTPVQAALPPKRHQLLGRLSVASRLFATAAPLQQTYGTDAHKLEATHHAQLMAGVLHDEPGHIQRNLHTLKGVRVRRPYLQPIFQLGSSSLDCKCDKHQLKV